ncbi:MAG: glycosyltransferase [Gammaproteobacteria bacterium]|nr:glycosyltransferase [Gammaproteobacteria bacterium]
MSLLLTIGLPTFNRAPQLEAQLAWLSMARKVLESQVEVIISDNCSSDETPAVISRWRATHSDHNVRVNRNSFNVGAVRNIVSCIEAAKAPHVWVVGDDDVIGDDAILTVISTLREDPKLALLVLNFSSRNIRSGEVLFERCFDDIHEDRITPDGKGLFEHCLGYRDVGRWGGLALTTALVCRTDLALRALQEWPRGLDNLTVQLFISGFCAREGSFKITKDVHLECIAGTHHFLDNKRVTFSFRTAEMAEAFERLARLGYSPTLCKQKILDRLPEIRQKIRSNLRHWPMPTIKTMARYLAALLRVQWMVAATRFEQPHRPTPTPLHERRIVQRRAPTRSGGRRLSEVSKASTTKKTSERSG